MQKFFLQKQTDRLPVLKGASGIIDFNKNVLRPFGPEDVFYDMMCARSKRIYTPSSSSTPATD